MHFMNDRFGGNYILHFSSAPIPKSIFAIVKVIFFFFFFNVRFILK